MMAAETPSRAGSTLLKLAKKRSCRMMNSLGSISRCRSEEKPRKRLPRMMPTSSNKCSDRVAPVNIHRYNRALNATIRTTSTPNCRVGGAAVTAAALTVNTSAVCTRMYSESKPMMEGVRIRLAVTVWNSRVETPTATATSSIAATFSARRGST
jgi:hypothetical protein